MQASRRPCHPPHPRTDHRPSAAGSALRRRRRGPRLLSRPLRAHRQTDRLPQAAAAAAPRCFPRQRGSSPPSAAAFVAARRRATIPRPVRARPPCYCYWRSSLSSGRQRARRSGRAAAAPCSRRRRGRRLRMPTCELRWGRGWILEGNVCWCPCRSLLV
ncbi:hypothetical protein BC834DRAFT_871591 [Gloeopeniophorella convolvens]|nr:hypothetical protein BC834DRAFT_871591 [Gloeopeniophorella convolvens]